MSKPLLRIPYTGPLPPPLIVPPSAATKHGAIAALVRFLTGAESQAEPQEIGDSQKETTTTKKKEKKTVLLTGAGLSTASGLADYRGANGTYTQNKTYRPIYFHEFVASHEARKRYWARSFLGWRGLHRSGPNAAHFAIRDLWNLGIVGGVVTQNVDSFHNIAHPGLKTVELHGYLRRLVCLSCRREMERDAFQERLAELNPAWAAFLRELLQSGALDTEDPNERRRKGFKTNPDGDADVPGAPYTTFRYPACPSCLKRPPILSDGSKGHVVVDGDGGWLPDSGPAGVLKPNVIMFGESIPQPTKSAAEEAVDEAGRMLVVGSSLATYSAWRLAKRALDNRLPIGILNLGGVRKEEVFFEGVERAETFEHEPGPVMGVGLSVNGGVRVSLPAEDVLPAVVEAIRKGKSSV